METEMYTKYFIFWLDKLLHWGLNFLVVQVVYNHFIHTLNYNIITAHLIFSYFVFKHLGISIIVRKRIFIWCRLATKAW